MMEQLALQQQIELLQQQQQQIAATHQQYVNMGMIQPQPLQGMQGYSPVQAQAAMAGMSPQNSQAFQFPQMQQQMGMNPMNPPTQPASHRRNQSALPSMGPPPAPSAGAAGSTFTDANQQAMNQNRENASGNRRGGPTGGGHTRRHSLALPEAKKAAELAEKKRTTAGFQFPVPGAEGVSPSPMTATPSDDKLAPPTTAGGGLGLQRAGNARIGGHGRSQSMAVSGARGGGAAGRGGGNFQFPPPMATTDAGASQQPGQSDLQRRGSQGGHQRAGSRNFEGNWRQQNNQPQADQTQQQQPQPMGQFAQPQMMNQGGFQPGHRVRGSVNQSIGSIGGFQYPGQPQLVQMPQGQMMMTPQMFGGQQLNALQMAQLQAMQNAGLQAMPTGPNNQIGLSPQQQRKTLFTPYLPQATLPALLNDGQLVAGILRVNKKNRSDAYVTTNDLDADIFICGSKDRNRALEGDLVAIELLDVDEVWGQKREKEEKKKRKDITDTRSDRNGKHDASASTETQSIAPDGSIRRRGSLRQRPTQKKNDDVEVEGQSLLLMEEEEISDDHKPLYAGHVVAVIERVAGQMFSGTLGLLRPSSQATKEKQEAERSNRDGGHGRSHSERQQDKPKIVWFKPTDKRVPLIAIPTEQAPRDFVDKHQDYANRIFVACIKRWPITSLHPFGTLVEQLGEMGDLRVETDALLRDNNFASDEFSEAVLKSVGWEDWSVDKESEESLTMRRDLRDERVFTIDPNGSKELDDAIHVKQLGDGKVEVGIHVADVAHFVKANSLVDREAKKRGTGVYLMTRAVNMLPPRLASDVCSLTPNQGRLTVSVIFNVDPTSGQVEGEPWIGKTIIKSTGKLAYDDVDAVINGNDKVQLQGANPQDIETLFKLANKFRETRFGNHSANISPLRLLYQLDDENVPVEQNIFTSSAAHEMIEELCHKANMFVAQKLFATIPDKAFLRRQNPPNARRLTTFGERMTKAGYEVDTSTSGTLQNSLFKVEDPDLRKGMETLLVKTLQRARYYIGEQVAEESRQHFSLNLPLYTHFTSPTRRYADMVVHRQLEAVLSNGAIEFTEELENLAKTAEQCNNKKDSAHCAQEQSVHIESCRMMDRKSQELGGDLIAEGIIICVYESAFDVLIPEYGFEKRVHCDQLPLKKAEFRKEERVLELYWEKGVPSSAYIPEDERNPRNTGSTRNANDSEAARQRAKERYEAQRKQTDTGTMSTDDVDALFDDDDSASEITEMAAGVSLSAHADRPTQSMPGSPTRNGVSKDGPVRTQSDSKLAKSVGDAPENKLTDKQKYLNYFKLREEGGDFIQDVTEMTRVPIILKTDLSKSPP